MTAQGLPSPFYVLRHGESENNLRDRVNGWTDTALTERGRAQARAALARLRGLGIPAIVCSPLARARETAAIVADGLGLGVTVVEPLKERHWGTLENQPRAQITDYFMVPEGGEIWETYRARVWAALTGAGLPPRALVVGHAGTMRVLRSALDLGDVTARLPNAEPVRFTRDARGSWAFETVLLSSDAVDES